MSAPIARFEFRIFGQCFDITEQKLRTMAPCDSINESREIYLLLEHNICEQNLKIRDSRLEHKHLVELDQGLQRWQPTGCWAFPIKSDMLGNLLNVNGARESFSAPMSLSKIGLLELAAQADVPLHRANVFKRRFRFSLPDCQAEVDHLLVNGAAIQSVAIESEDRQALLTLRSTLQLQDLENVAYPQAVARILGKAPLPHQGDYG